MNLETISEEYQKKFLLEFKTKKIEELKQVLDCELWSHATVSVYFQGIVDRINSIELFEQYLYSENNVNNGSPEKPSAEAI